MVLNVEDNVRGAIESMRIVAARPRVNHDPPEIEAALEMITCGKPLDMIKIH